MKAFSTLAAALMLSTTPLLAQDAPAPGSEFMLQWDLNEDGGVSLEEARERRGDIFTMFDQNDDGRYSKAEIALIDEHKEMEREAGKGPGHQMPEGMQPGQGQGQGMGKGPGQGKGMGQGMGQGMGKGAQGQERGMGPGANAAMTSGFDTPSEEGLAIFDTNGDGVITREEFVAGSDLWFTMRDRTGDGVINPADFGPGR